MFTHARCYSVPRWNDVTHQDQKQIAKIWNYIKHSIMNMIVLLFQLCTEYRVTPAFMLVLSLSHQLIYFMLCLLFVCNYFFLFSMEWCFFKRNHIFVFLIWFFNQQVLDPFDVYFKMLLKQYNFNWMLHFFIVFKR